MLRIVRHAPVPPACLWNVVADLTHWPDHLPTFSSIEPLNESRIRGLGSRFEVRQPGLAPAVYEVTAWTEGSTFTWVAQSPGATTTALHKVTPTRDGSTLELSVQWRGPLAPLLRAFVAGRARGMIESEADHLISWAATGE